MKKCAVCDSDYDDGYDGCPVCAKPKVDPAAPLNAIMKIATSIIGFVVIMACLVTSCVTLTSR
jgi:hypothetical protein